MKKLLLAASVMAFSFCATSQKSVTAPKPLKKVMTLQMALTADDDMPGTRGASVVWHPVQKKYYAAMAGNVGYPMCVFDSKGNRLSEDDHATQMDVRGLWYNPVKKAIQGNGYGDFGWFSYKLDAKGMVIEVETIKEGQNQPDVQCVGASAPLTKKFSSYLAVRFMFIMQPQQWRKRQLLFTGAVQKLRGRMNLKMRLLCQKIIILQQLYIQV
ncbi:MAG: hypothetical protein IPM85_14545 [Chitinophagaceae bacterium]|nr:hypothetical protein [Chitinophagaceae bacterium]